MTKNTKTHAPEDQPIDLNDDALEAVVAGSDTNPAAGRGKKPARDRDPYTMIEYIVVL